MKGNILIVEDEKKLSNVMRKYLENEEYKVECAFDGEEAEEKILIGEYDLIILDIMMPKKDGWSLLRKIKKETKSSVILTTARGEEEDRIFGLELGADDYMVKPLSMRELVLRVNLRVSSRCDKKEEKEINIKGLKICEAKRQVVENGIEISLTPKEFDLLVFLIRNSNIVFEREVLLNKVWGYEFMGESRTVDTHIKKLREKVDLCKENLKTVWRVGYKFISN